MPKFELLLAIHQLPLPYGEVCFYKISLSSKDLGIGSLIFRAMDFFYYYFSFIIAQLRITKILFLIFMFFSVQNFFQSIFVFVSLYIFDVAFIFAKFDNFLVANDKNIDKEISVPQIYYI